MESLKALYRIGSGPSSSHTMGPENACLYIKRNYPNRERTEVTLFGSLALTGKGHLTDEIIIKTLGENTKIEFDTSTKCDHPNTMVFKTYSKEGELLGTDNFVSIGGGEIIINGVSPDSKKECYPFKNFKEIIDYATSENIGLEEIVYRFDDEDIKDYLSEVFDVMEKSVRSGITKEGVLPGKLQVMRKAKNIFETVRKNPFTDLRDYVVAYAYSVSEENAAGGRIVTAPTCGASGVIPACLYYFSKLGYPKDKIVDSLAVAGLIGNTIKQNASISGAYLGCQAEVGAACSMAAGALSYMMDSDPIKVSCAAEIAMEHHLGLTCDPVGGLVQIPCIERNAIAALRAIDSAKMSQLPIYPERITFDMVIEAMLKTGRSLSDDYKETSRGGLAAICD